MALKLAKKVRFWGISIYVFIGGLYTLSLGFGGGSYLIWFEDMHNSVCKI